MAVDVSTSPSFTAGIPKPLFEAPILAGFINDQHRWQVAPDGNRFLLTTTPKTDIPPITVMLNWTTDLRK